MTFTCSFQSPPDGNVYLQMSNNQSTTNIMQVGPGGQYMTPMTDDAQNRVQANVTNGGMNMQFQFNFSKTSDSGSYQCFVPNGQSSNNLKVTVTGDQGANRGGPAGAAVIAAIVIGAACLLLAVVLVVLRFKYPERFACNQTQKDAGNLEVGNFGNPNQVYVVESHDASGLPQYAAQSNEKAYLPPNYFNVVDSSAEATYSPVRPTRPTGTPTASTEQIKRPL